MFKYDNKPSNFSPVLIISSLVFLWVVSIIWHEGRINSDIESEITLVRGVINKQKIVPHEKNNLLVALASPTASTTAVGIKQPGSGGYEEYDPEKLPTPADTRILFFFFAGWDELSRDFDMNLITYMDKIPAELVILKVDFDKRASLKTKYGVTIANTFVLTDRSGKFIKKWSDSKTLEDILATI